MPQRSSLRRPCVSSELNITRPSLSGTGCERGAEVQRADQLDVAAVVVHDEELHGGLGLLADAAIAVAIADEHDLAAGARGTGQVVDAARVRLGPLRARPRCSGVRSWWVS